MPRWTNRAAAPTRDSLAYPSQATRRTEGNPHAPEATGQHASDRPRALPPRRRRPGRLLQLRVLALRPAAAPLRPRPADRRRQRAQPALRPRRARRRRPADRDPALPHAGRGEVGRRRGQAGVRRRPARRQHAGRRHRHVQPGDVRRVRAPRRAARADQGAPGARRVRQGARLRRPGAGGGAARRTGAGGSRRGARSARAARRGAGTPTAPCWPRRRGTCRRATTWRCRWR